MRRTTQTFELRTRISKSEKAHTRLRMGQAQRAPRGLTGRGIHDKRQLHSVVPGATITLIEVPQNQIQTVSLRRQQIASRRYTQHQTG